MFFVNLTRKESPSDEQTLEARAMTGIESKINATPVQHISRLAFCVEKEAWLTHWVPRNASIKATIFGIFTRLQAILLQIF